MDEPERHLGFYFRCIDRQMDKVMNARLRTLDITPSQFEILACIARNTHNGVNVRQKDLETWFHVSNPTISGIITRLEQKGYVRRQRSQSDRRIWYIRPTEKEQELHDRVNEHNLAVEQMFVEALGEEKVQHLCGELEEILQLLQSKTKEKEELHDKSAHGTDQRV